MIGVSRSNTMLSGFRIISTNTEIGFFLFDDGDDDCFCSSSALSIVESVSEFCILAAKHMSLLPKRNSSP